MRLLLYFLGWKDGIPENAKPLSLGRSLWEIVEKDPKVFS